MRMIAEQTREVEVFRRQALGQPANGLRGGLATGSQTHLAVPVRVDVVQLGGAKLDQLAKEFFFQSAAVGGQTTTAQQAKDVLQTLALAQDELGGARPASQPSAAHVKLSHVHLHPEKIVSLCREAARG
ncbi:MAG: hypothetical protein IH793_06650 [Acidobacteria bacterium]|nr:hypothetical protein [Acidobacteriota bacterium]